MKREELRRMIKPMVRDCVHELLLEDGFLSTLISEVARGLSNATVLTEQVTPPAPTPQPAPEPRHTDYTEQKRGLMDAIGRGAYNGVDLFESTTPTPPPAKAAPQGSPMSGIDPSDRGIDISAIEKLAGRNWKNLI